MKFPKLVEVVSSKISLARSLVLFQFHSSRHDMLSIYIILILYGTTASGDYNDCGTRYALNRFEPAISYGAKTLRSEFPWHVAIYRHTSNESVEYICGGSILRPKVILTAAHCVYDETCSKIDNATFTVVAGKYHVKWDHIDPGEQRLKVLQIKIPKTFLGFSNRYAEDIAILELNSTINFTSAIMPVCIDWSSEDEAEQLPTFGTGLKWVVSSDSHPAKCNIAGRSVPIIMWYENPASRKLVVGWGLTENKTTSDKLLMANLKYIEFSNCRDKTTNGFSFFVTSDKFCAGLDNGTAVQSGDSGGGITFPRNTTNNKEQYYLYGIVSIKDKVRDNIAAFTDIRKHLHWLNITLLSITDPGLFDLDCIKRYRFNKIAPPFKHSSRNVSEYPWHIGVYYDEDGKGLRYYCGGTIIHPKAVLTVAHCIYDQESHQPKNETKYLVAAGKFKSSLKEKEPAEQRFQVKKIYLKETFFGSEDHYLDDIAVLELNDTITLSDYVMPACIDWNEELNLHKNPLTSGMVPAWDLTENDELRLELRAIRLNYIDRVQCKRSTSSNFRNYITPDKFCAASVNDSVPGLGSTGGSFSFPYYNRKTGEELNYIYGMVIARDPDKNTTVLTDITYHLKWIKSVLVSIIKNIDS